MLGGSLCVHQFFEGCAVGTVGKLCQLSKNAWRWTFVIFSLSLPSGVAIAIAAQLLATVGSNVGYQWALGLLTACAAGQPHAPCVDRKPSRFFTPHSSFLSLPHYAFIGLYL